MNKKIRIFVNKKTLVDISPFASIYSLKRKIVKKNEDLNIDKMILHFNGKILSDEKSVVR